ncbi:MAG TPA: hypothetical protein VF931_09540 [Steroidobacteraceae bacterium]
MTPFGDSSHQENERTAPARRSFPAKPESRERPTTETGPAIYRHRPTAEHALQTTTSAHAQLNDASLVFDAIYDAFLAQRVMLCAFAELRGEDGAESLW